jgi:hypothetical protein
MGQENDYKTDGGLVQPSLSWEDLESGKPGQPALPGFTLAPTVAERAFLVLSRQWHMEVQAAPKNAPLPRAVDTLALSCLLLAVEWGCEFTDVARQQIETNLEAEAGRYPSWYDQLLWELCQASFMRVETFPLEKLTVNLDHHNSSIRYWLMQMGWVARPWLSAPEAMPRLLKNLADTLGYPFEAAGLAAALMPTVDEFWTWARDFRHPDSGFAEQYADRLKFVEDFGILEMQAPFWNLEAQCRKTITDAVLSLRLVPTGA